MLNIFNTLLVVSGQRINLHKSKIIFSKNVPPHDCATITSTFNTPSSSNFGKYLGFPMPNMHPKYTDYQYLLDHMNNRLRGWKIKFLIFAGRTRLVRSVLNFIPTNAIQNQLLHANTGEHIDGIQRDFLWGLNCYLQKNSCDQLGHCLNSKEAWRHGNPKNLSQKM